MVEKTNGSGPLHALAPRGSIVKREKMTILAGARRGIASRRSRDVVARPSDAKSETNLGRFAERREIERDSVSRSLHLVGYKQEREHGLGDNPFVPCG